MTKEEYSINIEKLISWAKAYYVDDEPIASDEEYDKLAKIYHPDLNGGDEEKMKKLNEYRDILMQAYGQ